MATVSVNPGTNTMRPPRIAVEIASPPIRPLATFAMTAASAAATGAATRRQPGMRDAISSSVARARPISPATATSAAPPPRNRAAAAEVSANAGTCTRASYRPGRDCTASMRADPASGASRPAITSPPIRSTSTSRSRSVSPGSRRSRCMR